jgi:hypothetical protein
VFGRGGVAAVGITVSSGLEPTWSMVVSIRRLGPYSPGHVCSIHRAGCGA